MTNFTVKNIPPDLYESLKRAAEVNRRSINSEIIICIEKAVQSQTLDAEIIINRARKLREHTSKHPMTDRALTRAKRAGRL